MIKLDKFISEQQELFNQFLETPKKKKLIVAPTGSGKTYATIQYAKANPDKRIALLCPYKSLISNIAKDYDVPCGSGLDFLKKHKNSPFVVTTYDSIERLYDMDMFIIDESHLLSKDYSYREKIPKLLQSDVPTTLITATPEIIENLFNNDEILRFEHKFPRIKNIEMFCGKYSIKRTIINIIENKNEKKIDETVMIRINDKSMIDQVYEMYKNSKNIAYIYSDEDNVLEATQLPSTVENLKKGKISELDFILCTSIYDAGLSFEVDRDIYCYAISQDNRYMPNPIDMIQLIARVRENSGYEMGLTIIGNDGDFKLVERDLKKFTSSKQLCKEMNYIYSSYRELDRDSYIGLLNYYNIRVTELSKLNFVVGKVDEANQLSDFKIAKNFSNFTKEYNIIEGMLKDNGEEWQLDIIEGQRGTISYKNSAKVQQVFNILKSAVELGIDFDLFISDRSFSRKRFKAIESFIKNYKSSSTDTFSNLVRGMAYEENKSFKYKELGFFELNKSQSSTIKTVYNMMYKRGDFRRVTSKMKLKKGVNQKLVNLVSFIAGYKTPEKGVLSGIYQCDDNVVYEITQTKLDV